MAKREDRWLQLCKRVEQDDGLPVRKAQSWTSDKLWWWNRYIDITTTALVGRNKWPHELIYVDLFAGPGILQSESGERVPGSSLLAVLAAKPFTKVLLCEKRRDLAEACRSRVASFATTESIEVFVGDCNKQIDAICNSIPSRALTLAFVDPTGLHASFDTLTTLTTNRSVDLLILFADFMDIIRNVATYADQSKSKLDAVLGPGCDWRSEWRALPDHRASKVSRLFVQLYQNQLRDLLGYEYFGDEVLYLDHGVPLYRVLFASKDKLGLKFWEESTKKQRGSDRLF